MPFTVAAADAFLDPQIFLSSLSLSFSPLSLSLSLSFSLSLSLPLSLHRTQYVSFTGRPAGRLLESVGLIKQTIIDSQWAAGRSKKEKTLAAIGK